MVKKGSYSASGVDYSKIDPLKRLAQQKAAETGGNLRAFGLTELPSSRGESAYVWDEGDRYRAFVIEGLGSKNKVVDELRTVTGKTYYDTLAQDTVAMITNDLIVVGAMPQVVNAYFATGDSQWFADEERTKDLVTGWADACNAVGAAYGGGESPVLRDIIFPDTVDLAGAAIGLIEPKERLVLGAKLQADDRIILIESNGIHANGLTLARAVAELLPDRYATTLSDGTLYGEALLAPTHLYAKFVASVFEAGIDVHYMVNITGHGWRKLMRARADFRYVVDQVPEPHEVFKFIQTQKRVSDYEMYGNFNMGAGFALFVPAEDAGKVLEVANKYEFRAINAGYVEKGDKQVIIKPKNIVFEGSSLGVR
jgi:phosphoribosylformylglycinamidine cyclo-ligase